MQKKNTHTDKYLHGKLPDPEVPADEAWSQMNGMLGTAPAGLAAKGFLQKLMHFKWAVLSGVAATAVSTVIILKIINAEKPAKQKVISKTAVEHVQPHSALEVDSIIEFNTEIKSEDSVGMAAAISQNNSASDLEEKSDIDLREEKKISKPTAAIVSNPDAEPISNPQGEIFSNSKAKITSKQKNTLEKPAGRASAIQENNFASTSQYTTQNAPGNVVSTPAKSSQSTVPAVNTLAALNYLTPHSKIRNAYKSPKTASISTPKSKPAIVKTKPALTSSLHIGLDWNLNSSLRNTDYIFAGKDSVSKPALTLIPGIFVSKSFQKHLITFTASPRQTYFGNHALISHQVDSTISNDSVRSYNNLRFIKATGLNFSLYYHYQVTRCLGAGVGASYSIFNNALVRKEFENYQGKFLQQELQTVKKSTLTRNINPNLFAFKAGILFNPGRFQTGFNVILPISNIPKSDEFSLKSLNGQVFLRFGVK